MRKKTRWLGIALALILLLTLLSACIERQEPRIESRNLPTTQAAQTRIALTNAPPTAGPSPTPTATSTPYLTATPFPDADPNAIVAEVGERKITLNEYQARVRYERWLPLLGLSRSIDRFGYEQVLNLTLPENSKTLALFYTLGDVESMGLQTMDIMLTEQIILQEAARRDLELDQTYYDGRIAARIGVELGPNGVRPDNWDEAYNKFIEQLQLYTGMSEAQFLEIMRALTYYEQLRVIIGEQAPLEELDQQGLTRVIVQDLLLNTLEDAVQAVDLLKDGAAVATVARQFGLSASSDQVNRTVTRGTPDLPNDVINAIFEANIGDVVGPIATDSGWYVAVVINQELDILQPGDIQKARDDYFRQWILERLDNPDLVKIYEDNWKPFIPTDPLPQDVSPFMRNEFFVLPPDPYADEGATVTPIPISDISPR